MLHSKGNGTMKKLLICVSAVALFTGGNAFPLQGQASGQAVAEIRAAPEQAEHHRLTLERALQRNPNLRERLSAAVEAKDARQLNALLRQAGISGAANIGGPADLEYCEPLGEMTTELDCFLIRVFCATC